MKVYDTAASGALFVAVRSLPDQRVLIFTPFVR